MFTFENFKFWNNGSPVSYSGVILDNESRELLISKFLNDPKYKDWKVLADHMTICLRSLPTHLKRYWLDEEVTLTVRSVGESENALAVKVTGFFVISRTVDKVDEGPKFQHITLAICPDGKPSMSNDITVWKKVDPIKLRGVIKQVELNAKDL